MTDNQNPSGPADPLNQPESPTTALPPAAPPQASPAQPQQQYAQPGGYAQPQYAQQPGYAQPQYAAAPEQPVQEPPEGWQAAYLKEKKKAGWLLISTVVLGVSTLLAGALALGLGVWTAAGGDRHGRGGGIEMEFGGPMGPMGDMFGEGEGPFMGGVPGEGQRRGQYELRVPRGGGDPLSQDPAAPATPTPSPSSSTTSPSPSPTS